MLQTPHPHRASRHRPGHTISYTLGTLALCGSLGGCVTGDPGEFADEWPEAPASYPSGEQSTGERGPLAGENIDSQSQELFCGSEDWNDIITFDDSATYRIGAHYGKAVAAFDGGRCTGVLYGDRWLLTANHCKPSSSSVYVTWGDFASGSTIGRRRLEDLGVWSGNIDTLSDGAFSTFECWYHKTFSTTAYGERDIDVWRCDANDLPDIGYTFPGDIWGHTEMDPGMRSEGSNVYAVTYNKASFYSSKRVLLSPGGKVNDADDNCVATEPYYNCFEHSADTQGGSSGGAIFDRQSHRLFGLIHGNWGTDGWSCPTWATNYGSYLRSESDHPQSVPSTLSLPSPSSAVWAQSIGGSGGSYKWVSCPTDYLAAGVVGTTYHLDTPGSSRLGNFGLVCVPYNHQDEQSWRSTQHWRVAVGGSYDTDFQSGTFPFNEYMHETLDLYNDDGTSATFSNQEQSLTMCRPGFYMTGIRAHAGTYVDRIVEIECSKFNGFASQTRPPRKPLGTRSSTETVVRCPDTSGSPRYLPDRAVYGMGIYSGWLTDGFTLACRLY